MKKTFFLFLGALVALFILSGCGPEQAEGSDKSVPTPTPTVTSVAVVCPGSWAVVVNDRGDKNRWVATGVPAIAKAKTAKQAEKALDKWLVIVREDNVLLAGAVNEFFGEDFKPEDFVDGKCISDQGVQWALKLEGAMATAVVKPAVAPATGANNTGVEGEKVVSSGTAVITGDRAAVKVVLANGKGETVWVMARCGNLVVKKPVSPKGKTDNPPPSTHKPTTPPSKPTTPPKTLSPKDPSKDPQARGNVPRQATKTKPSDDNQQEVETRLEKPVDEGNGIPAGSSPRATPSASPSPATSASAPPSGAGTDPGVMEEPTEPAVPAPSAPSPSAPAEGEPGDF